MNVRSSAAWLVILALALLAPPVPAPSGGAVYFRGSPGAAGNVAVVDPGVGSDRPILVAREREHWPRATSARIT